MNSFFQPLRELSPRALRWSLALVLLCGSVLGYFVFCTFARPLHRQYQLNFGTAQWIEPGEFAPIAHFRRDIFLNTAPEQAWLEVAGTDAFDVTVNDKTIGSESNTKTRIAQIYDIKKFLKTGTNVIAISVTRTSYPGSAQLLVCAGFTEPSGKPHFIVSDESWRVTPKTGIVQGMEDWTSPLVHEEVWPRARRVDVERPVHITWVDTNPLLIQLPLSGKWIRSESASREAVFSTTVNADRSRAETWIQVASSGSLDLLVNGKLITGAAISELKQPKIPPLPKLAAEDSEPEKSETTNMAPIVVRPPQNGKQPQSPSPTASPSPGPSTTATRPQSAVVEPTVASLEEPTLCAYDISYWMKKGRNTIVAAVRDNQGPASFLASGFVVRKDGGIAGFDSNGDWQVGSYPNGQKQRAVETGSNGVAPWGYLKQELGDLPILSDFDTIVKPVLVILLTIVGTMALWLLACRIVAAARRESIRYTLARDALFHAPIIVALLFLLLTRYDVRFPVEWPFNPSFVGLAVLCLVTIRLLHFVPASRAAADAGVRFRQLKTAVASDLLPYLLLTVIIGLGFAFRYNDFGAMSFDHDEYGLVLKSKGVLELGFPFNSLAGEIKPATTYELSMYPMAITRFLFGDSEWATRLPFLIMGTLCIGLMAVMGRRLFNWKTGLIAALIYACLPLNIRWAQNAFYPQQCQFMAMLTFWLFYEGIRVRPFNHRFLVAATVTFCATYLSWEGSAFIIVALFFALLVVRWGESWWLKDWRVYGCAFVMASTVVAQLCWRSLGSSRYLQIGFSNANLSGPSLFFLQYGWQPMYYINQLLLSENHVFFTLMTLIGIPFYWRQPAFRYVVTLIGALLFCHTNLIAALSPRYCLYYQPLLILSGVAATVALYDRLLVFARHESDSAMARTIAHATGIGLFLLLFIQSNESLMRLYSLHSPDSSFGFMTRLGVYRYDHRGAAEYVANHFQPGDMIIVGIPHVFERYANIQGDYYIDGVLAKKVTYNAKFDEPRFMDKFRGYPTIRSLNELREVISRGRRTWLVFVPYGGFRNLNSPETRAYLREHAKVVFESYRAKVLLIGRENESPSLAAHHNAE